MPTNSCLSPAEPVNLTGLSFDELIEQEALSSASSPKTGKTQNKKPRTPNATHGINVNFCKNPSCVSFGTPIADAVTRGPGANNIYTVVGYGKGMPAVRCNSCGEHFPLKSNDGVFEEAWRIGREIFVDPSCSMQDCTNHRVGISTPKAYQLFGLTKTGSQRYRCRVCSKIFSVKKSGLNPIGNQQQSDKNLLLIELLCNKMPLRRICEVTGVSPRVLYERIDFFHEQAMAFMAHRESKLPEMKIQRLYIGVDRQEYYVNWTRRKDKKNILVTAVASADNLSGYVFGMHPNFDPDVDPNWVEQESIAANDIDAAPPFRKFSRLWLQSDYDASVQATMRRSPSSSLEESIALTYSQTSARPDVEVSDVLLVEEKLPENGMLVHSEYTLYGHFIHLEKLFKGVEKIRFFLDQDFGMRAACLGSFSQRIKDGNVDAFFVKITKEQTIDQKRKLVGIAKKLFDEVAKANPALKRNEVKLLMLKERITAAQQIGQWKDRWVMHPLPTLSEAEKASCFLTDRGDYDADHLAWLHNKASLHSVDSWFNRLRRRSSMLERPISSAANRGRTWHGYSAYKPEQIGKLLTIFRACHNYIWLPGDLKKADKRETPAMRLGLAKAPLEYRDIVYFRK